MATSQQLQLAAMAEQKEQVGIAEAELQHKAAAQVQNPEHKHFVAQFGIAAEPAVQIEQVQVVLLVAEPEPVQEAG